MISLIIRNGELMKTYLLRDIPDELLRALKIKAAELDTSMRDLILRYIEEGLRKEGKHGKK
jgi:plasmid stability protein